MPDLGELGKQLSAYLPAKYVAVLLFVLLLVRILKDIPLKQAIQSVVRLVQTRKARNNREDFVGRELFCNAVARRLDRINEEERWQDGNYSDLEAEVQKGEDNGNAARSIIRLLLLNDIGLREQFLSRAILMSRDKLTFLRGAPGSGKSVALRHAAVVLAKKAAAKRTSPIPIYVNLRNLQRSHIKDASTFKGFVIESFKSLEDIRQLDYLAAHYDDFTYNGRLIFFFDGFDEIVDVLSATEADGVVKEYQEFLERYLHTVGSCRAVIASREYRGPERKDTPQLTIVPLDIQHRNAMIDKRKLDSVSRARLESGLATATPDLNLLATNAMFMGLLCEYIQYNEQLPSTTDDVLRSYVDDRLQVARKYMQFEIESVKKTTAQIAYLMLSDSSLGLTATVEDIYAAFLARSFDNSHIIETIQVLRQVRLARSENFATTTGLGPPLTFSHRRFQEFFATNYLIEHPHVVTDHQLLLGGRWRESAVTILQHQQDVRTRSLLETAITILESMEVGRPGIPLTAKALQNAHNRFERFRWPHHCLHLLSLLDAGLPLRETPEVSKVRTLMTRIVVRAYAYGGIRDRLWGLDTASKIWDKQLATLFSAAFESGSQLLRDAAFEQVGRIHPIPEQIQRHIVRGMLTLSAAGELNPQVPTLKAQLGRLEKPKKLLNSLSALRSVPMADLLAHVATLAFYGATNLYVDNLQFWIILLVLIATSVLTFPLFRMWRAVSWPFVRSGASMRRFAQLDFIEVFSVVCFVATRGSLMFASLFWLPLAPALIAIYLLSWSPSVIVCLRGGFLRFPAVYIVPAICAVLVAALAVIRSFSPRALRSNLIIVAVSGGISALIFWSLAHRNSSAGSLILGVLAIMVSVVALLMLVGGLLLGFYTVINIARDLVRLGNIMTRPPKYLSAERTLAVLSSFRTSYGIAKVMTYLRSSGVLASSGAGTAALLNELSLLDRWTWPLTEELKGQRLSRKDRDGLRRARIAAFTSDEPILQGWINGDPDKVIKFLRQADRAFWDECGLAVMDSRPA